MSRPGQQYMSGQSRYLTGRQNDSLLYHTNNCKPNLYRPDVLRTWSCYGYLCNAAPTGGCFDYKLKASSTSRSPADSADIVDASRKYFTRSFCSLCPANIEIPTCLLHLRTRPRRFRPQTTSARGRLLLIMLDTASFNAESSHQARNWIIRYRYTWLPRTKLVRRNVLDSIRCVDYSWYGDDRKYDPILSAI